MEERKIPSAKEKYKANRKGLRFLAAWADSYLHPKEESPAETSAEPSSTHNEDGVAVVYTGKNRREYYRQHLDHKATFARLDEEGNTEVHVQGKLLDISANGVKFTVEDEEWAVGDTILVDWNQDVPWTHAFKFKVIIRRIDDSMSNLFYGCEIVDMSEHDQESLVQMVFKLQQEERIKRGHR